MSSVRSPATNLRSSDHDFCCNRNTTTRPIQTEEKGPQHKSPYHSAEGEIYHTRVIVISITMLLADPNGAVPSLIPEYPQALCYELRCSRVQFLSTDSYSYCHDFCCDRNTTARLIQIEEKALSIHSFIVQRKERYLRPRFIVISISITMLLAAPNCGVPRLSLYYSQVSRHELRCSRVPLLFLIL